MKLEIALDQIERLRDEEVVLAKRPWKLDSEAMITELDSSFRVPEGLACQGYEYFLDVPTAKEVLLVFGERRPSIEERRALLMYYAENDAFPDWVYRGDAATKTN